MFQSPVGAAERDDVNLLRSVLSESKFYGQDELSRALRLTAEKGYEDCAKVLLQHGALPDIHDKQGFTALMIACRQGHADIVRALLDHKCKIDKAGFGIRSTGAHLAASYGHTQCLKLLLEAGGDMQVKTARGLTPLMLASRSGYDDCVELLLRHGAGVNMSDFGRDTALHYASEEGNTDCARLLCRSGADINKKNVIGNTPLLAAAKNGHVGILKLLTRDVKTKLDIVCKELSLLHWAASSGSVDCVQFLLDHGHNVDKETSRSYNGHDYIFNKGLTPLMVASIHGHRDVIVLLLEHGAEVNKYDGEGFTPLAHAVNKGHPDCVLVLIRRGAEIDVRDPVYNTTSTRPLFIAIKKNIDCLKILLRVGAQMTYSEQVVLTSVESHITPMEFALKSSYPGITCRMLVAAGYRLNAILCPVLFQECMAVLAQMDEDLFYLITDILMVFPSLFLLCRNRIRFLLGRRVISHLDDLPLPSKLKDAIYLKELDSFECHGNYTTLML